MKMLIFSAFAVAGLLLSAQDIYKEKTPWRVNYDESKIPAFTLPEVLADSSGRKITTLRAWEKHRPELLKLFENHMYGKIPPRPDKVLYELLSEKQNDLNGLALRREVRLHFEMKNGRKHYMDVLMYIPQKRKGKVPVFAGLIVTGNHSVSKDKFIRITGLNYKPTTDYRKRAETLRGCYVRRFPLEQIMKRGYAVAFAAYHDTFPDRSNGWDLSIYRLFSNEKRPADGSAISAWAWGKSRILDYLETVPEINAEKAAVIGHSRLGKAALWAGVCDERFKLVCVNNSGCGGTAPSRRLYGETLYSMFNYHKIGNYWFVESLKEKALTPEKLPFDQHQLVSLIAPRSVSVHCATLDQWADPKGEYLSLYEAGKVYRLYGKKDILSSPLPPEKGSAGGRNASYYLRVGKHDIVLEDWNHYMDMADLLFKK